MYLPDDSPCAVTLFIGWLYRGNVPIGNTEAHLHHLYDLYILADKLCLTNLQDTTMDAIQDMALKYDLLEKVASPVLVAKVLKNIVKKGKMRGEDGLRKFSICVIAQYHAMRAKNNEEKVYGEAPNGEDDEDYVY